MAREFTGRHMFAVLTIGFGIVIAVNFLMAGLATSGFGGVVVTNSYVASQKFNGWLEEAERERALGWSAQIERAENGRLHLQTAGVDGPATASVSIRRPLGNPDASEIALVPSGDGSFTSPRPLPPGRWIVRTEIKSGGQTWRDERELR